jgi:hypothetical protein
MNKIIKHTLLLALLSLPILAHAQTAFNGHVSDAQTNEPLIGATVIVKGEKAGGTVTDSEGNFKMTSAGQLPLTLIVNYAGYRSQEIQVYDTEEALSIQLRGAGDFINEVVVVGYGAQKRQQLTSAISSVGKDLLSQPLSSVESVLAGS